MKIWKGVEVIRWVATPTRQSLASSRKRTLRSRSAMAARSVWSGGRSRVIESRNFEHGRGLLIRNKGGSIEQATVSPSSEARQAKVCEARPGSESRADARVDNPGTREILVSPSVSAGRGRHRLNNVQRQDVPFRASCRRSSGKVEGIGTRAASEAPEREQGSLRDRVKITRTFCRPVSLRLRRN